MSLTLVGSPYEPDRSKIRLARLAWIAETLRLPLSQQRQALRAPARQIAARMLTQTPSAT